MSATRCPYCGKWFAPASGKGERQKTCGQRPCRRRHKRALDDVWRNADARWTRSRREKVRAWAGKKDYWRQARERNPGYVERNRRQTRERMRRLRQERRLTRRLLADAVGYLRDLKGRCLGDVCKTGTGGAQSSTEEAVMVEGVCKTGTGGGALVEVVDYLIARECLQNRRGQTAGQT